MLVIQLLGYIGIDCENWSNFSVNFQIWLIKLSSSEVSWSFGLPYITLIHTTQKFVESPFYVGLYKNKTETVPYTRHLQKVETTEGIWRCKKWYILIVSSINAILFERQN